MLRERLIGMLRLTLVGWRDPALGHDLDLALEQSPALSLLDREERQVQIQRPSDSMLILSHLVKWVRRTLGPVGGVVA